MSDRFSASSVLLPSAPSASDPAPAEAVYLPLYQQIKALLVRSLQGQEWAPGQAIPAETELAARYKVSQGTVRKAIDELAAENLLVRRQGKGTFVATHDHEQTQFRFLRLRADGPEREGPRQRRYQRCEQLPAPASVAAHLGLAPGAGVLHIRRTLGAAGADAATAPVICEDIWLPAALFPGLTLERLLRHKGPLYAFFEREFNVRMTRARERLRAVAAGPDLGTLLGLDAHAPLLQVERLSLTYDGSPVELRLGHYDTREHHYWNRLD
ncbi:GntR family transcriptional regulator [Amphibiibacter pelophylacis]|uniref:GntR family transcriptional regulator n=1 Tax=Amphibiibacter pelophylacis TaxID=1799477 RepID=A0ACC6P2U1_9BURK